MAKHEIGAVVRLASGGPNMTITGHDARSTTDVNCMWFSGDHVLLKAMFPRTPSSWSAIPLLLPFPRQRQRRLLRERPGRKH
jgi:uncharacterized protein YodC (DUF2158 family)